MNAERRAGAARRGGTGRRGDAVAGRALWAATGAALAAAVAAGPASAQMAPPGGTEPGISFEEYRRLFPPAPVEVRAAVRGGLAVVSWKPPPAPDPSVRLGYDPVVARYRIYRLGSDEQRTLIGETEGLEFADPVPPDGARRYVVTAVQRSGLESAASVEAVLPGR